MPLRPISWVPRMRLLCLTLLITLCFSLQAEEYNSAVIDRAHIKTISIVAPVWEGYTNQDGTGAYWEVLKAIYEPLGISVKTKSVPWNRAMKMVSKYRTYNAIVGEYRDTEENVIFPDYSIDTEYMSVLSKNTSGNKFINLSSLTGKTVGWIKDYEVIAESKRDFKLREFRNIEQGIEYLNGDKLDFLIDDWDEIAAAMKAAEMTSADYSVDEMPEGSPLYVAFSEDNLSKEFIKIYNERIPVLAKSGKLEAIYTKWDTAELPEAIVNLSK
ncbi:MAG: polar amino acid transport system substrate-binding protein [Psychrobacter glaciei]|jgi:polar amino acid transport system substrate-binding protein